MKTNAKNINSSNKGININNNKILKKNIIALYKMLNTL